MKKKMWLATAALLAIAAIEFGLWGAGATRASRLPPLSYLMDSSSSNSGHGLTDLSAANPTPCAPVSPPCQPTCTPPPSPPNAPNKPCTSPRPPASIELEPSPDEIVCDGQHTSALTVHLRTASGGNVANGLPVFFSVFPGVGSANPPVATTKSGEVTTQISGFFSPRFGKGPINVYVNAGRLEATIRIFCAPSPPCSPSPPQPPSPPCGPTPPVSPPPCGGSSSPPPVSPPCPTPTPSPTPRPPSIGGEISIGTPSLQGSNIGVPVLTSASQDPYTGFSVHLKFDGALLSFLSGGSGGALETSGSQALCISVPDTDGNGGIISCSTIGAASTTSAGTLGNIALARKTTSGCSNLHLETLGPPDGGDTTTGTYTIATTGTGQTQTPVPQRNTYGPDVSVNVADGATGCAPAGATPTPTPTATPPPAGGR